MVIGIIRYRRRKKEIKNNGNSKGYFLTVPKLIPWKKYDQKYAKRFCQNNGAPALKFRMVMGTLIIKQKTGHSDEEVLQDILENPYM